MVWDSCTGLSNPTGSILSTSCWKAFLGGQELGGREFALVVYQDQAVCNMVYLGICQSPQRHLGNTSKSVPYL